MNYKMAKKVVPHSRFQPVVKKIPGSVACESYKNRNPSWRVSYIDWGYKWCIADLLDPFTFTYSESIFSCVLDREDEKLDSIFERLNGKQFESIQDFWKIIHENGIAEIPVQIIREVTICAKKTIFQEKIFPKLMEFETNTWQELDRQAGGPNNHSRNHSIAVLDDLDSDAQKRLRELKYDDVERLYSLRFDGETRMYGILRDGCYNILWLTLEHDICLSNKKHT